MWGTHEGFLNVVQQCWSYPVEVYPIVKFSKKLKRLKKELLKWNVEIFGRVEVELKANEASLDELEHAVIDDYSQEVEEELLCCKQRHIQILHREEILGCQKSRVKWLTEGDSNLAFFHAAMRVKRKTRVIDRMELDNG